MSRQSKLFRTVAGSQPAVEDAIVVEPVATAATEPPTDAPTSHPSAQPAEEPPRPVPAAAPAAAPPAAPSAPAGGAAAELVRHGRIAQISMGLFCAMMAASCFTLGIDGAVVASGVLAVETNVKKVQHQTGGTVSELLVSEGRYVQAGDVLIRLDPTVPRVNLGIVVNELTATRARLARLQAERDGRTTLTFPGDLVNRADSEPDVAAVLAGEDTLFRTRANTRNGQKQQLTERIGQLRDEIRGTQDQLDSTRKQTVLAKDELKDLNTLWRKGLVPRTRVSQLEREVMRNEGLAGELTARIAQSQGRISETEVQMMQLDKDLASEVPKDMREAETKIAELQERRTAAEDQLRRIDIRAPTTGFVLQLAVHTVGGVVQPGEQLMQIVPDADRIIVEARVSPMDIDRVEVGQETSVRLSAFNGHTTPQVNGTVTRVGADLIREVQTQQAYFPVGVTIKEEEIAKLKGLKLSPGMPADAFIKTGERTIANYLLKPVRDQFHRALRED